MNLVTQVVGTIIAFFVFFSTMQVAVAKRKSFIDGADVTIVSNEMFATGPLWSDETRATIIGGHVTSKNHFDDLFGDEFPLFNWMKYAINDTKSFEKMSTHIAFSCRQIHKNSVMATISCLAASVRATLKKSGWPNEFTFCRAHATAFRGAFEKLNIPRSRVDQINAGTSKAEHTANRFTLTSTTGQAYSYVIDVGNKHESIFPATEYTESWHQSHTKIHHIKFPDFSWEKPVYLYYPKEISVPAQK